MLIVKMISWSISRGGGGGTETPNLEVPKTQDEQKKRAAVRLNRHNRRTSRQALTVLNRLDRSKILIVGRKHFHVRLRCTFQPRDLPVLS